MVGTLVVENELELDELVVTTVEVDGVTASLLVVTFFEFVGFG